MYWRFLEQRKQEQPHISIDDLRTGNCAVSSRQTSWRRGDSLWMPKGARACWRRGKGQFLQKERDIQTYRGRFKKVLCGWSMECIIADGAGDEKWCPMWAGWRNGAMKRAEDESENFGEHFPCPAGIQKEHRELLLNYARIKDENSSKHTLKWIPVLQTKAPSVTQNQGEKYFGTSIFG